MTTPSTQPRTLRTAIILLTAATALIHLLMAVFFPDPMFTPLFLLNAAGYIALLAGYFLPQLARYHNLIRWLFILFTAATIAGYVAFNLDHLFSPVGVVTKLIEIALIVCLFLDRGK
jgi:hypothetical protein